MNEADRLMTIHRTIGFSILTELNTLTDKQLKKLLEPILESFKLPETIWTGSVRRIIIDEKISEIMIENLAIDGCGIEYKYITSKNTLLTEYGDNQVTKQLKKKLKLP